MEMGRGILRHLSRQSIQTDPNTSPAPEDQSPTAARRRSLRNTWTWRKSATGGLRSRGLVPDRFSRNDRKFDVQRSESFSRDSYTEFIIGSQSKAKRKSVTGNRISEALLHTFHEPISSKLRRHSVYDFSSSSSDAEDNAQDEF